MEKLKIICVCGARPNFMKIAPIMQACEQAGGIDALLVHTGQHYDEVMSRIFFDELGIPKPDLNLEVGSASHAVQTAEVMKRFEPVCIEHRPDWVVVVGDVNSTLACSLVAVKLGIKAAHVEAGLRSFDRRMPEEINRLMTDAISDLLLVSEPSGLENLRNEGVAEEKVEFVGNVMIDTLMRHRKKANASTILNTLSLEPKSYAAVTLHRPENVDSRDSLTAILRALETVCKDRPVVCPMHPRTRGNLEAMGLTEWVSGIRNLRIIEPVGYLDFLKLMTESFVVMTDSGGIQEETTILGVPCLTLRENTERPITLTEGTNRLAGCTTEGIVAAYHAVCDDPPPSARVPELWDGRAAERIVEAFLRRGSKSKPPNPQVHTTVEPAKAR